MISRIRTLLIAGLAVTTLASPIRSLAQEVKKEPHHYRLIDLGTFGGPESSFKVSPQSPTFARVLNNQGAVAGNADTSMPDPFLNFCFGDCFVSHAFEWENGVKTDLRALHGGASSASNWISANGLIAGLSENGKTDPLFFGFPELRAVLWHNGTITDLGTLPEGGFESGANAVNSRGQVVGFAMNTIPDSSSMQGPGFFPTQTRAFLWQNGAMQDLGTLGTGTDAQALFINEKGQVAGWSYINSTPNPACFSGFLATGSFIWDKENGLRDLGSLGGACTLVADLNEQGQIAGVSNLAGDQFGHAFLWNKGSIQDLGGGLGGNLSEAFAINNSGETVGLATLPGDAVFHATLWKRVGLLTDLGVVPGDQCSIASSINARTQVVGASTDCVSSARAFLWENGKIFDLNALVATGSSLFLQFTVTINDSGEITGTGVDADANQHAFLAIPCDEDHPNVEGCDYSLVDSATSPLTRATPIAASTKLPANPANLTLMAQLRSIIARRHRSFGALPPK